MKQLLKSFYRNFTRKPVINFINIIGLAVSLALVIILVAYCYCELTTDKYHANGKRVYYKTVKGNLNSALKEPMSIVITKSLSNIHFGQEQALGKTIKYDNKQELTIRTVLDENRMNSCLSFNAITANTTSKAGTQLRGIRWRH
jgi:hypothetical protein